MSNDTIYVLSTTYKGVGEDGGGSIYLKDSRQGFTRNLDQIAHDLIDAKVFYSRQEAWNAKEDTVSSGWQITPISAKKLFTKKLKGL